MYISSSSKRNSFSCRLYIGNEKQTQKFQSNPKDRPANTIFQIIDMSSQADSVDMSLFYGTPEQKQAFSNNLVTMLKKKGCIKVQNHRIPDEMIQALFEWVGRARDLFLGVLAYR